MTGAAFDDGNASHGICGASFNTAGRAGITRRDFVQSIAAAGIAVSAGSPSWAAEKKAGDMIYRTLGRTGEKVSAIGLGGFHIGLPQDEPEGIRVIGSA